MLERYKLGELNLEDQRAITEALSTDDELRSRLEQLDESDRKLRLSYPAEFFRLENARPWRAARVVTVARFAGLAALITAGVIFPVLYFFTPLIRPR
jgi:Flp pilus assembly protein TadB